MNEYDFSSMQEEIQEEIKQEITDLLDVPVWIRNQSALLEATKDTLTSREVVKLFIETTSHWYVPGNLLGFEKDIEEELLELFRCYDFSQIEKGMQDDLPLEMDYRIIYAVHKFVKEWFGPGGLFKLGDVNDNDFRLY